MNDLLYGLILLACFVPAVVFHEVAHGYVSYRLGDPTAKMKGRLSLNPLRHVDPFGTVILPILLAFTSGMVFGYAKPVPINPHYYRDYRKGLLLSGLAGPAANLALALIAGLVFRLISAGVSLAPDAAVDAFGLPLFALLMFVYVNLMLMFFNLLPIPPLDGSSIYPLFLSNEGIRKFHEFERYSMVILFGIILLAPRVLGFSPISAYLGITARPLLALITGVSL